LSQAIPSSKDPSICEESHEVASTGNETSETSLITDFSGTNGSHGATEESIKRSNETAIQDQSFTSSSVSREASATSMISDTSDMIVTPYQSGLREDLNVHTSSYLSPIRSKRYDGRDERRAPADVETLSSHSDNEDSSLYQDSANIVQFDANQEDHISRVHLDLASGHLVRIECDDGPLMEGFICSMPVVVKEEIAEPCGPEQEDERLRGSPVEGVAGASGANAAHSNHRPQMLWKGPSKFFRRQKAQPKIDAPEIRQTTEPVRFDEFGRLL
jgi:hypothetical protein